MTMTQLQQKEERSAALKVFQVTSGDYYVESSKGKVCYRVSLDNGNSACTCGDFNGNIQRDPHFICKHILQAMRFADSGPKPRLDDRFIIEIQGSQFVKYAGILDLAHQKGLQKLRVETTQYPTKENGNEAICRAILISKAGEEFIDFGDANPLNVNSKVVKHILRVASTRAKARVLRDFTNIGMTCLEELADLDEATDPPQKTASERSNVRSFKKAKEEKDAAASAETHAPVPQPDHQKDQAKEKEPPKQEQPPAQQEQPQAAEQPQGQADPVVKITTAQINAIISLAKRRGLTEDEIRAKVSEKYNITFDDLNTTDARELIRQLQKSA